MDKSVLSPEYLKAAGYVPLYREQNGGDFVRADAVRNPERLPLVAISRGQEPLKRWSGNVLRSTVVAGTRGSRVSWFQDARRKALVETRPRKER